MSRVGCAMQSNVFSLLETTLLLGDFEEALHLARKYKTRVTNHEEYAICLCVEIQALFELGREKEAREIAESCVVENGIAFENFSLLNTCVSLFLVVADSSGWQLAETTLQRWQQMERQHRSECVRFSIEQKKHLWGILLLHVLPQRGLEGIEKGLYIVTKELPYWDLDRNWVKCVEQELICRKEAVEKETRVEESSWVQEANIPRTTGTSGIGQAEELSTDNVTERNESVWSKTWTLVQQVDSPMFRISVVASFCLLLYSLKRSFQTTRTSHPLSQGLIDILRMAFGLSYGRPGI